MKRSQIYILFIISVLLVACGKDTDTGDCLRDEFIGTYTGISRCERQLPVDATVILTAGTADDELILDLEGTRVTVKVDGCTFSGSEKATDVDLKYEGELDANKITVELTGSILSLDLDCKTEAIK